MYEFHKEITAPNGCVITRVTRKIDKVTILEDADGKAYVPIDDKSIKVEDGKLTAIKEALVADGVATHLYYTGDSERVDVLFDDKSIKVVDNKLYVNIDNKSILLDSEGHLYVDFTLLPDNVTIKQGADGRLAAQYEADEDKGLHLDGVKFEVKVDDDTVHFDSEGKLTADFLRYVGEHGAEVVDDKISVLTDDKTIEVGADGLEVRHSGAIGLDSEGLFVKHDDHTIVLNANNELKVPVQDLVHVEEPFEIDASVADEVTLKLKHDDSLEVTSEGKLHAVARQAVASEGIIVTPNGETSVISVDFDHKTLVLGSEGLEVKIRPNSGISMSNGLKVDVDNVTVKLNSEGKLISTSTPISAIRPVKAQTNVDGSINVSLEYDGKTILLGSEGLYVPIDKDSILLDGGLLKAKKQLNADGLTILENSETLSVNIDNKTILASSGVLETAVGGWKEAAIAKTYINNAYNGAAGIFTNTGGTIFDGSVILPFAEVPLDGATVDLKVTLKAGGGQVISTTDNNVSVVDYGTTIGVSGLSNELTAFTYDKASGLMSLRYDIAAITIRNNMPLVDTVEVSMTGMAAGYHTIDPYFIPVDNASIIIKNGHLVTAAPSITAGAGLEYTITPTANVLDILTDSESIRIRGDKIYVPILSDHTPAEEDLVLTINSEGKPEWLKRAGVVDVVIDSESMVSGYVATIPAATDTKRGVVKYDNDTIVLNSEGQIKVVNLVEDAILKELVLSSVDSEGVRTKYVSEGTIVEDRVAKLDLTEYSKLNETGYRIELFMDGEHADSESGYGSESSYILKARLLDQAGNVLTTSNAIDLPLESMIIDVRSITRPLTSETSETVLIFTLKNGKEIEIPLGSIVGGFVRQHADYLGTNSIGGSWNFANELYNHDFEVINVNQTDGTTVIWNDSENYLEVLPYKTSEGIEITSKMISHTNMAGEVISTPEYTIGVKFDHDTVRLNSEGELSVPVDGETLVIENNKLVANIDKKTIIYDSSEGHIELPLDNVTITLNSEGFLEAAGLDVKAGDAIEISTSEEGGLPVKYINVKYDEATVVLDSEGKLSVPIDKDSIIISSEGLFEVDQYTTSELVTLWNSIVL